MKRSTRRIADLSHVAYTVVFTTSLYVVCNAVNLGKLAKWFPLGDGTDYVGLGAYLVFGLCVFMAFFVLFAHRWMIKPLSVVLVILSAAATYFIAKYNVAIDRSMILNSFHTDRTEVSSLLSVHMLPYVFFLIVLPVFLIARVNITFQATAKYLSASGALFIVALLVATAAVYLNYNSLHRAANLSDKYIIHTLVPVNVIRSLGSLAQRSLQSYASESYRAPEISGRVAVQDDLVVVLAIGETSRQKSFTLYGYDRKNTNPQLSKDSELHVLNGIARKGTTLYALPEILERDGVKLPAITSKLGIETSCFVNYTLYDNCRTPGEVEVDNCGHGGRCYDEDVLPLLEGGLASYESGYRFVVLHLGGGSHGPSFSKRYPPEFQVFNPQCFEADVINHCTEEELYNAYDNSILYVDYVVSEAIRTLDESGVPYVFIYLSDHGESLLEEDRIFHGMPPGIPLPPEQARIPLIVKSSVPVAIREREAYTQQDVYDTVLALFSIETEILKRHRAFIDRLESQPAANASTR